MAGILVVQAFSGGLNCASDCWRSYGMTKDEETAAERLPRTVAISAPATGVVHPHPCAAQDSAARPVMVTVAPPATRRTLEPVNCWVGAPYV